MRQIHLNFLQFKIQDFGITIFRKKAEPGVFRDGFNYYDLPDETGIITKYEVSVTEVQGYKPFRLPPYMLTGIISKEIYLKICGLINKISGLFILNENEQYNRRIYFQLEMHSKGRKCIWIEPYYLKAKNIWGLLIGYKFLVDDKFKLNGKVKQDRDILIASGTLNQKGQSNTDFYLFKHDYLQRFINFFVPQINEHLDVKIDTKLFSLSSDLLKTKEYIFNEGKSANSPYIGLTQHGPLESISQKLNFHFIYRKEDRDFAVALLKGLRGQSFPTTFPGMDKFFEIDLKNENVKGVPVDRLENDAEIEKEILDIKSASVPTIPVIIMDSRKNDTTDRLYFELKHKFTNAGIPCQVVTKDLLQNEYSFKYSLSNIALQIFSKAGGKPWKMKPASNEYLIIGIGQSYNIEKSADGNTIEKNITYSILTDSSGIFKDIQVLSEGIETNKSYYQQLISNIVKLINVSGYKRVTIHSPIRLSKDAILDKVVNQIGSDVELNVLVINNKTDYFGFDYANNGLVPFESTFIKLSNDESIVWFEGLQFNNPKITKRYGNPLLVKYWYSNKENWLHDYRLKEILLQDCINLSGANWRGFKAKQLPVSIFYCQRIAEFIGKFRDYNLDHIEINNLKPWFL